MKDISESLGNDLLVAVIDNAVGQNHDRQIWLDAVVDGKLSMSNLAGPGAVKVYVAEIPVRCNGYKISIYHTASSGHETGLLAPEQPAEYTGGVRVVPIFNSRFREWWSWSVSEGSLPVRWRLQLDAYLSGSLVGTYTQDMVVTE